MPARDQYGTEIKTLDDEARYIIIENGQEVVSGATDLNGWRFKDALDANHIKYNIDQYLSWTYIIFIIRIGQNPQFASTKQLADMVHELAYP
jgi:hypothetical protein